MCVSVCLCLFVWLFHYVCVRPVTEPIFSIPKATVSSPKYVINFETAQNTESILFVMMRMS